MGGLIPGYVHEQTYKAVCHENNKLRKQMKGAPMRRGYERMSTTQATETTLADVTPRWEYKLVKMPREATIKELETLLNSFGGMGWELCDHDYGSFIFKRISQASQ